MDHVHVGSPFDNLLLCGQLSPEITEDHRFNNGITDVRYLKKKCKMKEKLTIFIYIFISYSQLKCTNVDRIRINEK